MTNKAISLYEREQQYLKRNAVCSLVMAVVLVVICLDKWFNVAFANWLYAATVLAALVCMLVTIRDCVGSVKAAFWYGEFQDEFANHLHQRGCKNAFLIISIALGATFGATTDGKQISGQGISAALGAVLLIAYALPVLKGLRAENE
ncbi:hypothetical protein [Bowmanella yangjiangensis]|uniref:Uncharacterized protein n=1 Tax=Bowmanella yangjiangensis TaxID=2811230 RepID=A0ABS3D015_9ALTE|nr:hypothetical protein [Bowmanella yangjiangensis]MBN7821716.1 hypothetical protein [Bowmanella yangjiangensis]